MLNFLLSWCCYRRHPDPVYLEDEIDVSTQYDNRQLQRHSTNVEKILPRNEDELFRIEKRMAVTENAIKVIGPLADLMRDRGALLTLPPLTFKFSRKIK